MLTIKVVTILQITIMQIITVEILSDNLSSNEFAIISSASNVELVPITSISLLLL
jgi:hypothetical protein